MERIRFGKTGLMVSKIAFGGIPIQRLSIPESVEVVRGVINLGVNFIDTAHSYTNSEEKIGLAIKDIPRDNLVIASKSPARDKKTFLEHVDLSLKRLCTDYIDLYQFHNLSNVGAHKEIFGEGGAYEGLIEAISAGKVRFPGFTSHSVPFAIRVMRERKLDAVQLPLNYIDNEAVKEAVPLAKELDMGFIAMKPFGGGLLSYASLSIKYLLQFDNIVPDPGIEKLSEMEEIARIVELGEEFSGRDAAAVEKIKADTADHWCHRCDYCQPCPQGIGISMALNINSMIRRMPYEGAAAFLGSAMNAARNCTGCRECVHRCPYNLSIPELLKESLIVWDGLKKA
jgi:predicted aldo/keto reductase-like oxidoreductase